MESRNKLTMCRLCLCENECFINIFQLNDWEGYVAAKAISDLLQFQVSETDGYPHVVCSTCLMKLSDFKLFKECCEKSKVAYDDMFVSSYSLAKHDQEMVEFVSVKEEPVHYLDNEANVSKACSKPVGAEEDKSHDQGPIEASYDLDGTDGDEFKEGNVETTIKPEEVIIYSSSDEASENPFGESKTEASCGPIMLKYEVLQFNRNSHPQMSSEIEEQQYLETTYSTQGRLKVSHEGFIYLKDKIGYGNRVYWECEWRKVKGCKGRVITLDMGDNQHRLLSKSKKDHNHAPEASRLGVSRARASIKRKAECVDTGPAILIQEARNSASHEVSAALPSDDALAKMVRRTKKRNMHTKEPESMPEMIYPR